jgi:hypothetical protein
MESAMESRVIFADRIGQGVIIEFDDGTSALYSASLLRSILPKAKRLRSQQKPASFATASNVKKAEPSRAK